MIAKLLIAALLALIVAQPRAQASGYTECTITHYANNRTAWKEGMTDPDPRAIFGNWRTPNAGESVPPDLAVGLWNQIDLTDKVPAGTRCVAIAGQLIITRGYRTTQACTLFLSVRTGPEAGRASNTVYATSSHGGVRSPYSVVVPLREENGRLLFDASITIDNHESPFSHGYYSWDWPDYCSFGVSGFIEGFGGITTQE